MIILKLSKVKRRRCQVLVGFWNQQHPLIPLVCSTPVTARQGHSGCAVPSASFIHFLSAKRHFKSHTVRNRQPSLEPNHHSPGGPRPVTSYLTGSTPFVVLPVYVHLKAVFTVPLGTVFFVSLFPNRTIYSVTLLIPSANNPAGISQPASDGCRLSYVSDSPPAGMEAMICGRIGGSPACLALAIFAG